MVLHVHHTFLSSAGGLNPGKQHFSVKKAPETRFCAAISHLVVVISTFQMLLNILKYTLSVLGGDSVKLNIFLWTGRVQKRQKVAIFCCFHTKNVVLGL